MVLSGVILTSQAARGRDGTERHTDTETGWHYYVCLKSHQNRNLNQTGTQKIVEESNWDKSTSSNMQYL